ncbi:tetratricopeptide repeat protein [Coralliovum pocilloporae]|uniref:tetratricopeptide repeat protein n=1 Tax=Coralliovum pocilloporae TaxID=3066369 RepID=UPI0033077D19
MSLTAISLDRDLKKANKLARKGRVQEARALFEAIAERYPSNQRAKDGLRQLGQDSGSGSFEGQFASLVNRYKSGSDATLLSDAVSLAEQHPDRSELHNLIGILYAAAGQTQGAIDHYQTALKLDPENTNILNNLGNAFRALKRYADAEDIFQQAIKQSPDKPELFNNLAATQKDAGKRLEAIPNYIAAIRLNPQYYHAHINLAVTLNDLKRYEEAARCCANAIEIKPDEAEAHFNLSTALYGLEQPHLAIDALRTTVQLQPDHAAAHGNLATFLLKEADYDNALQHAVLSVKAAPDRAEGYNNLACVQHALGQNQQALQTYIHTLKLRQDYPDAHHGLARVLLSLGHVDQGLDEYEWRMDRRSQSVTAPPPQLPLPSLNSLDEKVERLFVWPEQGVGDEVMFASMFKHLSSHVNADIIAGCDKRLIPLFERSFPDMTFISRDETNRYTHLPAPPDRMIASGSLLRLARKKGLPLRAEPYLKPDTDRLTLWKDRLEALPHPVSIGISWYGGNILTTRLARSIQLEDWAPILNLPANFINLQYGAHKADADRVSEALGVSIHDWDDADPLKDLDNFTAQVAALDLVISIDNSTVHFAGALGKTCFTLLPTAPDWRWMPEENPIDWYQGALQLFRQETPEDWSKPIKKVTEAARIFIENK